MEYNLGNKKLQLEYNIEEEITPSQITLRYIPIIFEKQTYTHKSKIKNIDNNSTDKTKQKNKKLIPKRDIKCKKHYLLLKCDKAYSGVTNFFASNINIMKFEKKFFSHFRSLIIVDLSYNNLLKIPGDLFKLNYIKELNLEHNHINYIQHQLSLLINLEILNLSNNDITQLPNSLFKLLKLQILLINYNKIKIIPIEIGLMKNLEKLNIYNNQINELPTTLCNISKLKNIEFEWLYILKKSFFLSDFKEIPDDDLIYEKCFKYFSNLYNKNILYCDKDMFFNNFKIQKSLYNETIISTNTNSNTNTNTNTNTNSNNINETTTTLELKRQKRFLFGELIKYIKLKDIQNVYKYANLIMSQKNYKEEDFLSKNKLTPLHYLFSSFNQIKLSSSNAQNKNMSNITEKDSMIINENNKICSSRGNKITTSNSKTNLSINKIEENTIIAKSKIIGNFLFGILSNKIINNRSYDHWGPIHIAIRRGGFHCLEWIINKNKAIKEFYIQNNNINNNNNNIVDKSLKINNFSSIGSFSNSIKKNQTIAQKKGFNLNLKGKEDWSPLHLSASLGLIDCVYLLLKNNAEVYSRNNNYKTPKQVSNVLEINKLLTLYENYVLEEKYNNNEKDINKNSKLSPRKNIPSPKSSQYYPSRANINFFKEIFTNNEYSLGEISEAMSNLTMSVINPINKNYINENILNKFFENCINELDLFSSSIQNRKNIIIISGFNSIGISLNNLFLMKLYQKILLVPKLHLSNTIKQEMISYINYISVMNNIKTTSIKNKNNINTNRDMNYKINSYNNKPKIKNKSKNNDKITNIKYKNNNNKNNSNNNMNNKKKINIINLATNKNKNIKKKIENDESESSNTNSFIIDSDGLNSRNKYRNYLAKKAKIKNEQGNTIISSANESCNIQESSLSVSGIDLIGAGKIKYNK